MRARLLVAVPIALVIGCSLAVDTTGLSGGQTAPADAEKDGAVADTSTGRDAAPDSDAPADSGNGCPGGRGPSMVRVSDKLGAFCIDSTRHKSSSGVAIPTTDGTGGHHPPRVARSITLRRPRLLRTA